METNCRRTHSRGRCCTEQLNWATAQTRLGHWCVDLWSVACSYQSRAMYASRSTGLQKTCPSRAGRGCWIHRNTVSLVPRLTWRQTHCQTHSPNSNKKTTRMSFRGTDRTHSDVSLMEPHSCKRCCKRQRNLESLGINKFSLCVYLKIIFFICFIYLSSSYVKYVNLKHDTHRSVKKGANRMMPFV